VLLASYLSLVAAAASGPAASDVAKEAKPVQVEFDAPTGCSGADAFFSSLRSRTDMVRQADGSEPHTTLQVRLTRTRGRVLGELRVVDDRGGTDTRKMQGATCDDVVQALSLTAALAMDPSALLSAPATAPVPGATSGTETSATPLVPTPPGKRDRSEAALSKTVDDASGSRSASDAARFEVGTSALGTALLTSSTTPGIAVSSRWTLAGHGVLLPTLGLAIAYLRNDAVQSPGPVQVSLTEVVATGCPLRFSASMVTLQPCALVAAGWFTASGRQAMHNYEVGHLWLSAGGTLRVAAALGHGLSLELEGGAVAPLFKRRFYSTTQKNIVGETSSISPVISIGLSYGF